MAIPVPEKRIASFEKRGFGMFIHWGLYSQLGQGEWIMNMKKIPKEEYSKLMDTFTAEALMPKKSRIQQKRPECVTSHSQPATTMAFHCMIPAVSAIMTRRTRPADGTWFENSLTRAARRTSPDVLSHNARLVSGEL